MHITVLCIGFLKSGEMASLAQEYLKRMSWKVAIKEFEAKKNLAKEDVNAQENAWLLSQLSDRAFVIVCDERGDNLSSRDFADLFEKSSSDWKEIIIILGGADGLSDNLRKRANKKISFGKLTWPHKLARVMLLEQLYRCQQILNRHPYHRD